MPLRRFHFIRFYVALVFTLVCALSVVAQQRPLITEDVDIIPPGSARIEAGIEFFQDARFPVSGLRGDLTRVGVVGVNFGLSPNVEFQIEGVLQNFLSINSASPNPAVPLTTMRSDSTNDTGDFRLSTKIKLRNETRRAPSLGFRFGVELPNSSEGRGIGIFTAPTQLFTQNDMLLYGIAGIVRINRQINVAGEINGRANTRGGRAPLGTESLSEARLGLQIKASGLRFDFAGSAGLTDFSPRSSVIFGITYDTPSIFTPVR